MDKIKLLTATVIALLLLNIGTLGFLILTGPMQHHRGPMGKGNGPQRLIIEKLHFDEKQQAQYQQLIHWHRGQINALDNQIHQAKNRLYTQLLKNTVDTKTKDSLIDAIAVYQKQIEMTHFKHFEDIKKLCKPEQLEDYYNLTEELANLFSRHPPRPEHD